MPAFVTYGGGHARMVVPVVAHRRGIVMFPQGRAAPKIAAAIDSIIHDREPSGVHVS